MKAIFPKVRTVSHSFSDQCATFAQSVKDMNSAIQMTNARMFKNKTLHSANTAPTMAPIAVKPANIGEQLKRMEIISTVIRKNNEAVSMAKKAKAPSPFFTRLTLSASDSVINQLRKDMEFPIKREPLIITVVGLRSGSSSSYLLKSDFTFLSLSERRNTVSNTKLTLVLESKNE